MFARGYFAHTSPDGQDPFARMDAAGIKYMIAGENLAEAGDIDSATLRVRHGHYDQSDAEGFINLSALRLKIRALRDRNR